MNNWRFKLLYDGECPFCLREVRWLQHRNRLGHLAFEDISSPNFDPSPLGVTREELLGVIHGVFPDGRIVNKVEVFRQAYRAVGLGWLIAPTGWPGLRWIFNGLYSLFARYRSAAGAFVRPFVRFGHMQRFRKEMQSRVSTLTILLYVAGAFAVLLGILHFTFPKRFGFLAALPADGEPVPPYRLLFYRYDMKRSDLRGIIYVMNHCVSYAIVAAGVFDGFAARWLGTFPGALASGTIAGFWFVRAGTQFYLGRRPGDWFVVVWFALLGALHVVAALQILNT